VYIGERWSNRHVELWKQARLSMWKQNRSNVKNILNSLAAVIRKAAGSSKKVVQPYLAELPIEKRSYGVFQCQVVILIVFR